MRLYSFAEQIRLSREQPSAVIKQRWPLAHNVAHDPVDADFMEGREDITMIGERHLLGPLAFLGTKFESSLLRTIAP